uniref:Methyltransferase domain-containing protein n=1 Tax=Neobodo designis TaxID=312471 RepID=A0A7S1Q924_NEODS|mmetsp:Transcript_35340/g.109055  ORF Transcript_35340/g.109055 Transcript_35340/m.109055 type:complete len:259 (+) Transcript_35340:56-832(+)
MATLFGWIGRLLGFAVLIAALALGYLQQSCSCRRSTFSAMLRGRKDDTPWTRDVVCPHIRAAAGPDGIRGTVVDVGTGAGVTLFCYQNYSAAIDRLVLVEPLAEFGDDLRRKIKQYGLEGKAEIVPRIPTWVLEGKADLVVSVHLLCSVDEDVLPQLLTEIGIALRPNGAGKYAAIDHTTAPEGTWVRFGQRIIAPIWFIIGNGCKFLDIPPLYSGLVAERARVAVDQEAFSYPLLPWVYFIYPHAKMVGTSLAGAAV